MNVSPQHIAAEAVRVAKDLAKYGCEVTDLYATCRGTSCYIKAHYNARKFVVRVSNHHSRIMEHGRPYYYIRLDRPEQGNRATLDQFVRYVAAG